MLTKKQRKKQTAARVKVKNAAATKATKKKAVKSHKKQKQTHLNNKVINKTVTCNQNLANNHADKGDSRAKHSKKDFSEKQQKSQFHRKISRQLYQTAAYAKAKNAAATKKTLAARVKVNEQQNESNFNTSETNRSNHFVKAR